MRVIKDLKGAGIFECSNYRLRIGRQKNASRNMEYRPHDELLMNPEGRQGQ